MHRHCWTLKLARGLLISASLGVMSTAHALGLGKLTVHSGLDEALNADIELTATSADELKKLTAGLASRDEFDNAGIERSTQLNDIKYTVSRRADGRPILKLSSDQPMREPFLHFLLQVNWQGGRLLREYTALLDPPQLIAARQSAVTAPVTEPAHSNLPAPVAPAAELNQESNPTAGTTGSFSDAKKSDAVSADVPRNTNPETVTPEVAAPTIGADELPGNARAAKSPVTVAPTADDLLGPSTSSPSEAQQTNAPPAATRASTNADLVGNKESAPAQTAASASTEYGPIKRGETLSQITKQLNLSDGVAPEQVMLALLKANKSAFFGNNVNNLKTGKVLAIPDRSQIQGTPRTVALKEFHAQYSAWQEYKLKLASTAQMAKVPAENNVVTGELNAAPARTPAAKAPETKTEANAKSPTAAETKTDVTKPDQNKGSKNNDLLRIVRANPEAGKDGKTAGGDATAERKRLADRATTLEEAVTSKEMENKELRERVSQLETQVKNTKRLIELENKDLAKAQQQASKTAEAKDKKDVNAAASAAMAAAKTGPAVKSQSDVPPTNVQSAPNPAPPAKNAEKAATANATPAPVPPDTAAKTSSTAPTKSPVATPAPAEEPSFFDGFLKNLTDNALGLPILLGVLAIAGVMALVYMRKRRRAIAEFGESILAGGGINANSEGNVNAEGNAGDVSFLSDFSQGGMGNIHTDEVDPIAEAEVYLAYGRDEQAEEILKEAVVKDPNRHELRLKLLEIYHQRNDLPAFETVAEELYASLEGKGGKVWEKAEEMGRKMSPDNPLFRGAGKGEALAFAGAAAGAAAVAAATLHNDGFAPSPQHAADANPPTVTNDVGFDLDFNTDTFNSPPPAAHRETLTMSAPLEPAAPESNGIDFDFNSLVIDPVASESTPSSEGVPLSDLPDFDVSFEPANTKAVNDDARTPQFEAIPPEFDNSNVDANDFDSQIDETATKLDLAKAYIDMGDADGARSILDEVLAEGNDVQKKQAAELARQIAA